MKTIGKIHLFSIILTFAIVCLPIYSNVRLPKLVSDGMVIQRNANVKIWGWADPAETISVRFIDSTYVTTANEKGEWSIVLRQYMAGGPYIMEIHANNDISVNDILIGDVWVCSGQSNMETTLSRVSVKYPDEIANSKNDYIRYFYVPQTYNFNDTQSDLPNGKWLYTNPENVPKFSAVAYFFAKEIYNKYKVPVGLINNALGGSPAEAWMSEEALKAFPNHYEEAQKFKDSVFINRIIQEDRTRVNTWYKLSWQKDEGNKDLMHKWCNPSLNTSDWAKIKVPGYWSGTDLNGINGVVWFRKEIQIPASLVGKEASLILGRIVDADSTFVNGTLVGSVSYQYPPRRYTVPAGILKEGRNIITVRLISNIGTAGFVPDKAYELTVNGKTIDLKGDWQYRIGTTMEPLIGETFIRWKPTGLYNAMLAPLFNYQIKGVLWYQGESNTRRWVEYKTLLPTLINDWRQHWNRPDLPFLVVQLHNFMETKSQPGESEWASLREVQRKTLDIPNTGLVVTIDLGEWNDIHPLNKQDVGKRLALAAQKVAYGDESVVYSGPIYQSMKVEGNKAILTFTNTGSGLIAMGGGELKYFAIAGEDNNFVWANAKIENDKVILWNDKITKPVAVRYAWADNPEGANLYNKEGLPASPFRTDE
jgi:sialate O-acetylesterase